MYGIDYDHVIVAIAMQVLKQYVNIQLFVVHIPNRTIPAQTNNDIVVIQRLLSRPYSMPAQFNVNANCSGYNRHCTSLYNINRNVRFNTISPRLYKIVPRN